MGQLQDKVLGVSFLKQLECWCNVVRYYPYLSFDYSVYYSESGTPESNEFEV